MNPEMNRNILIAVDASENSRRAVQNVAGMLEEYRRMLMDAGFAAENVSTRSTVRYCPSMADCILAERDLLEYATLVVGRQWLSRKEEFLFGSISGKIVRIARNCTVWVVE